jgi:hypothetical protein
MCTQIKRLVSKNARSYQNLPLTLYYWKVWMSQASEDDIVKVNPALEPRLIKENRIEIGNWSDG